MRYRTFAIVGLLWAPWLLGQLPGDVLLEDDFSSNELDGAWSWLRQAPQGWELSDGTLRLRTNGDLWKDENTQRNLLLTEVPSGAARDYVVEVTVRNRSDFTERYEHGGLIWYWDDDNWVTLSLLNHVQHKTQKIMLVHETEGDGRARDSVAVPYLPSRVVLRLVVQGDVFTGFYRESAEDAWQRLGSITFPAIEGSPRVGPTAGSTRDKVGHWVTFDDFSLLKIASEFSTD